MKSQITFDNSEITFTVTVDADEKRIIEVLKKVYKKTPVQVVSEILWSLSCTSNPCVFQSGVKKVYMLTKDFSSVSVYNCPKAEVSWGTIKQVQIISLAEWTAPDPKKWEAKKRIASFTAAGVFYEMTRHTDGRYSCTCPAYQYSEKHSCKHLDKYAPF